MQLFCIIDVITRLIINPAFHGKEILYLHLNYLYFFFKHTFKRKHFFNR